MTPRIADFFGFRTSSLRSFLTSLPKSTGFLLHRGRYVRTAAVHFVSAAVTIYLFGKVAIIGKYCERQLAAKASRYLATILQSKVLNPNRVRQCFNGTQEF